MTLKQQLNSEQWDGALSHLSVLGWAMLLWCPVLGKNVGTTIIQPTNQSTKDCHANILQELRSCVKAEVAVLGSPSLIVSMSLWMSNNTELEKHIEFSYFAGQKPPVELLDDCAYAIHWLCRTFCCIGTLVVLSESDLCAALRKMLCCYKGCSRKLPSLQRSLCCNSVQRQGAALQ